LAEQILLGEARKVLLMDHSEDAVYRLGRLVGRPENDGRYRLVVGDAGDISLVRALLEEQRVEILVHAAAYKHVPLMEANPFAAVKNNAILTWRLARLAAECEVPQMLLISTDKAANPRSLLGVSKRLAEMAVVRWSSPARRYAAVRLVNVLGSSGSVVPLLLEQIARGGPVTVTHAEASRYFMTMEETVRLILGVMGLEEGCGAVYVPRVSEPVRIVDLASELLRRDESANSDDGPPRKAGPTRRAETARIAIEFTGLRAGDKLSEEVVGAGESLEPTTDAAMQRVLGAAIPAEVLDRGMGELEESMERRDIAALVETLCRLVPEYQPSSALSLGARSVRARANGL
jgi:FlaA1/EpsC-like NDP-sugar epimerase